MYDGVKEEHVEKEEKEKKKRKKKKEKEKNCHHSVEENSSHRKFIEIRY
jgi:hypothetical protein